MNNNPAGSLALRETSKGIVDGFSERLVTAIPGLHPNHVTIASTFLACGANVLCGLAENKHWSKWAIGAGLVVKCVAYAGDALDGSVANLTGQKSVAGAALDAGCDRVVEIAAVMPRMVNAYNRGDSFSAVAFLIYGLSCLSPSFLRAAVEANGVQCQSALAPLELAGSSFARRAESVLSDFLALYLNDSDMRTVRLMGAGVLTSGNLAVAVNRVVQWSKARRLLADSDKKVLDNEAVLAAKLKCAVLGCVGVTCSGLLAGVFWYLNNRKRLGKSSS